MAKGGENTKKQSTEMKAAIEKMAIVMDMISASTVGTAKKEKNSSKWGSSRREEEQNKNQYQKQW